MWETTPPHSLAPATTPHCTVINVAEHAYTDTHTHTHAHLHPHPLQVSRMYRAVPYHNFHHCTDVAHTTFMFIK